MSAIDNGGPAFPLATSEYDLSGTNRAEVNGMTLRDYFAAKAMQAIITKLPVVDRESEFGKPVVDKIKYNADIAESAYWFADAMIKARGEA